MKNYLLGIRENLERQMLNDCMRMIFGERVDAEVNAKDYQMKEVSAELEKAFSNLPISMATLIGMAVQKNGGKIEFDPYYSFREGILPFTSLKYDSTYGVYGCFGNMVDPTFDEEFIYLERELTTEELNELYIYLKGDLKAKMSYLNAIYTLITTQDGFGIGYGKGLQIYYDNVVELKYSGDTLAHLVYGFYVTDNGKVAVSVKSSVDDEVQHELLRDFSLDEVKSLFNVFIKHWYSTDVNKQICD